jgi:hypothetical protein
MPRDYGPVMRLDAKNGNTCWSDASALELAQLHEYKAFTDHGKDGPAPAGYKKIQTHLVFDTKHDGQHKAIMVDDGHLTDVPLDSVYSGVVSIRGLHTLIFLSKLNSLQTWSTDIGNAYLEAETLELVYIIAGPEFGELEGHTLVFSRHFMVSTVLDFGGMSDLLIVSVQWVSGPPRLNLRFGCVRMVMSMNTLVFTLMIM